MSKAGIEKNVAVITSVRNDRMFTKKWIDYYSAQFGAQSLFMVLDGFDQAVPDPAFGINTIRVPFIARHVVKGEKSRAARASHLAAALFENYDIVIAVDIDEFLVVDPSLGVGLRDYLSGIEGHASVSGLGIDVIEKSSVEAALQTDWGFLEQRSFGILSHRYTKPAVAFQAVRWGSGQHRVKGQNFHIDPNLFIFHFGNADRAMSGARLDDPDRKKMGWTKHQIKREALYQQIEDVPALEGDEVFGEARARMTTRRPIYALNKPGQLKHRDVVRIPDRFRTVL